MKTKTSLFNYAQLIHVNWVQIIHSTSNFVHRIDQYLISNDNFKKIVFTAGAGAGAGAGSGKGAGKGAGCGAG